MGFNLPIPVPSTSKLPTDSALLLGRNARWYLGICGQEASQRRVPIFTKELHGFAVEGGQETGLVEGC